MGHRVLGCRRDIGPGRVGREDIPTVLNQSVRTLGLLPHLVGHRHDLVDIPGHRLAEALELEREDIGVDEPQQHPPGGLRQRDPIREGRVAEADIVVERVEDRVIRPTTALAAVAQVERRNPEMLQKRRVVGAGAQGADREVTVALEPGGPSDLASRGEPFRDADVGLGVDDVAGDLVDETLEGV